MHRLSILRSLINHRISAYIVTISLLIGSLIVSISIGSVNIPFSVVVQVLIEDWFGFEFDSSLNPMFANIILNIRLPRVLLAMLVGASLALAGAAFQGLLKNPLADPFTLGISSGAAVGAVVVLFFGVTIPFLGSFTLPIVSISFGFLTLLLVIFFARILQRSMSAETIILVGIIISSFLGSLISLMIALTGEELRQILVWIMGSVAMKGTEYILLILPFFVIGFLLLFMNGRELNALAFGEETARQLGVNVQTRKILILLGASLLTGASVAVSGTIGFVGLVIPHLTRLVWGPDHRHLLPLSMLVGASFLTLADLIARTIVAPAELPIGVITAIIGGPAFALILIRGRHRL